MSSINNISNNPGFMIDYSALLSDDSKKKSEKDEFSEILSSLMTPPPPPPPAKHPPMDLEKLSEVISSSTSISDSDKEKILSLIETISKYAEDNDIDSVFASLRSGAALTDDQKKVLDTLKSYQDQLVAYLKDSMDDLKTASTEETGSTS